MGNKKAKSKRAQQARKKAKRQVENKGPKQMKGAK